MRLAAIVLASLLEASATSTCTPGANSDACDLDAGSGGSIMLQRHESRSAKDPVSPDSSVQQQIFEGIYQNNTWETSESLSGEGSELADTEKVRACLGKWIEKYSVKVLIDIPCGDANWQGHIPGIEKVEYYGYDISTKAIDLARGKNPGVANMHFDLLDLSTSDPPEVTSDSRVVNMIIVKGVLQHVPLGMGLEMLRHAKSAGIKWLAVTTVEGADNTKNANAEIGGSAGIPDVQAPPFNLPEEYEVCEAYSDHEKMRLFYLEDWDGAWR